MDVTIHLSRARVKPKADFATLFHVNFTLSSRGFDEAFRKLSGMMKAEKIFLLRPRNLTETMIGLSVVLFVTLTILPFKALDLSVARTIYALSDKEWFHNMFTDIVAYRDAKWLTTIAVVAAVYGFLHLLAAGKNVEPIFRFLVSVAVCLILVWLLKLTSGVACPWSLAEFSQRDAVIATPFSYLWSTLEAQGRCWPAGHAGTGFCLFGFYFMVKDYWPKARVWAGAVLVSVLVYGLLCSVVRMSQGAHFLSHTLATLFLDFAVAGFVFTLGRERRKETISPLTAALLSAVAVSLAMVEFLAQMVAEKSLDTLLGSIGFWALFVFMNTLILWPATRWMPRRGWRFFVALFTLIGAVSNAVNLLYGTVLSADMIRNALATDFRETYELLSLRLIWTSFVLWLPGLFVAVFAPCVQPTKVRLKGILYHTLAFVGVGISIVAFIAAQSAGVISFWRMNKEARLLIAPYAAIYSFVKTVTTDDSPTAKKPRLVIDSDPKLAGDDKRPLVVVMVVGETARAANWGLSGYRPDTTPELAKRSVVNFTDATACGSSTDVSLPCMFSRVGRSDYDRKKILAEESVLSVIRRAGVDVRWVDNQSGCKGACTPEMLEPVVKTSSACPNGTCWDEAMLGNVDAALKKTSTSSRQLLVLHMMGSHGPAYWRRTPENFRPFGNGCLKDDFGSCTTNEITASYNNSIAYTDRVLAQIVDRLEKSDTDAVMLYVSDHGESLGENGLWLHGAPYWAAPDVQIKVPMVFFANDGAKKRLGLSDEKLRNLGKNSVTHDNLFDSLLGLTGTQSKLYRKKNDLFASQVE